jgi:hypothetical protein
LHLLNCVYCSDETTGVCVMQLQTTIDWSLEWGNVHKLILPVVDRLALYTEIHYITQKSVSLHRNRLTGTKICTLCVRQEPNCIESQYEVRQLIWEFTRTHMFEYKRRNRDVYQKNGSFALFRTLAETKTSGDLVFLDVFLCGDST